MSNQDLFGSFGSNDCWDRERRCRRECRRRCERRCERCCRRCCRRDDWSNDWGNGEDDLLALLLLFALL
ncbi:hypothetical protein [Clostridium sp. Marseille-QA1073]